MNSRRCATHDNAEILRLTPAIFPLCAVQRTEPRYIRCRHSANRNVDVTSRIKPAFFSYKLDAVHARI